MVQSFELLLEMHIENCFSILGAYVSIFLLFCVYGGSLLKLHSLYCWFLSGSNNNDPEMLFFILKVKFY